MNSTEYSADRRDIQFVQKELFPMDQLADLEAFKDFSPDDFAMVVSEGIQFAETVFGSINVSGDQEGTHLVDGKVVTAKGFAEAWKAYSESGWMGMNNDPKWGGQGLPRGITVGVQEALFGANPALYVTAMLTSGSAGLITTFGDDEQNQLFSTKMISGEWGGTMCLSEPNAGSAVGDITTSAKKSEDGSHYKIKGTKQWISGGDHDMAENIIHLVLARIEGAPPGPKGISLFIVPKRRLDDQGNPAEDNDVTTVRVEHKLGIKASPTCVLEFGTNDDCHGYLLEGEQRGLAQMFKLMNEARLTVAYQGLGSGSGAYRNALAYARERVQGIPIEQGKDQSAPRASIVLHPDVRRDLMTMKAIVEGVRGLIYGVSYYGDMAHFGPEETKGYFSDLVDILTPVAKNAGADNGYEVVRLGIQVLGGVGYTEEFPLAQTLRDTKIASIYEGTTGIQALDLVTRKLTLRGGEMYQTLLKEFNTLTPDQAKTATTRQAIESWQEHVESLSATVASLGNLATELGPREGVFNATEVTVFFGDVCSAYYLLKSAVIAEQRLEELLGSAEADREKARENEEARFYFNKVKTAEHYTYQILPRGWAVAAKVRSRNFAALDALLEE